MIRGWFWDRLLPLVCVLYFVTLGMPRSSAGAASSGASGSNACAGLYGVSRGTAGLARLDCYWRFPAT